jgi:hypothetical protein
MWQIINHAADDYPLCLRLEIEDSVGHSLCECKTVMLNEVTFFALCPELCLRELQDTRISASFKGMSTTLPSTQC